MASFRTGFKIFGKIWLKPGLGRIRSFSEDRKPGQWLPEDQWAVRQPGSTCPDPCEKPKKPKVSKSWLSICKDPDAPKDPECDIRHNNCPPPPIKSDAPWYSLEKLIPKKKQEKAPPLQSCREEIKRRELLNDDEEVCENIQDKTLIINADPDPSECCMPKEPCPAPVVNLSCPLPKELDIMLWCSKPCTGSSRIYTMCESDRLPYQEFRPPQIWKTPPFSLPTKSNPLFPSSRCYTNSIAFEEFKHVTIPKPLYTRYKSVELSDSNLLLCMTDVPCSDNNKSNSFSSPSPPPSSSFTCCRETAEPEKKEKQACPEKQIIKAASCEPVRIKKATKYVFRPKPTKLIERRAYKNPLANKTCDFRPSEKDEDCETPSNECECSEPPKVITSTLTHEPQMFERHSPLTVKPPKWMYAICKPGCKETPLVPGSESFPEEPDWCSETDGLKFYDDNNENIFPIPPRDPCLAQISEKKVEEPLPPPESKIEEPQPAFTPEFRDRFVMMPECYNIKNMRRDESSDLREDSNSSFDKFIKVKTAATLKTTKSYSGMKENILYDLQRLCPNPPLDLARIKDLCRKPTKPDCPDPPRFYRSFSTFGPSESEKLYSNQLFKIPRRTECGDSSGKCKVRKPSFTASKPCPEPTKTDCAEITLPCCPKARIPPDCNSKRNLPPCKKKLPPKPSFSECAKDQLPCPKPTECNAWDKALGGKNRK